jgi:hypothetical protein
MSSQSLVMLERVVINGGIKSNGQKKDQEESKTHEPRFLFIIQSVFFLSSLLLRFFIPAHSPY